MQVFIAFIKDEPVGQVRQLLDAAPSQVKQEVSQGKHSIPERKNPDLQVSQAKGPVQVPHVILQELHEFIVELG